MQHLTESTVVRPLLVVGVMLATVGGLVVGLSWQHHGATVLAGVLLAAAGQFLALLGLAGRGALEAPRPASRDRVG